MQVFLFPDGTIVDAGTYTLFEVGDDHNIDNKEDLIEQGRLLLVVEDHQVILRGSDIDADEG